MDISPDNLEVFAKLLMDAVVNKQWALLASLALVGVVWAVRRFGGNKIPWLKTDVGGAASVLALSILGAVSHSLAAGQPLTWGLLLSALKVGFMAAGGYSLVKKLLGPVLAPPKAAPETVVAKAEAAGAEAAKHVVKVKFEDLGK